MKWYRWLLILLLVLTLVWVAVPVSAQEPPTPPAAPSELSAVAVGPNQVNLAWSDNSLDELGFRIERTSDPIVPLELTVFVVPANALYFGDTTVAPGKTYFYRVLAFNLIGNSLFSNMAAATTPAPPPPPLPPAAPSELSAFAMPPTAVRLNWIDNSPDEDGFRIERALDYAFTRELTVFSIDAELTGFDDDPVAPGTTYFYRVFAFNVNGISPPSNPAKVFTPFQVEIDIKPGSFPNTVNIGSTGVLPVAVLTTETFDAARINPPTVTLAFAPAVSQGTSGNTGSLEDVDDDGDLDLMLHFLISDLEIEFEEESPYRATVPVTLMGLTYDYEELQGTDTIYFLHVVLN